MWMTLYKSPIIWRLQNVFQRKEHPSSLLQNCNTTLVSQDQFLLYPVSTWLVFSASFQLLFWMVLGKQNQMRWIRNVMEPPKLWRTHFKNHLCNPLGCFNASKKAGRLIQSAAWHMTQICEWVPSLWCRKRPYVMQWRGGLRSYCH